MGAGSGRLWGGIREGVRRGVELMGEERRAEARESNDERAKTRDDQLRKGRRGPRGTAAPPQLPIAPSVGAVQAGGGAKAWNQWVVVRVRVVGGRGGVREAGLHVGGAWREERELRSPVSLSKCISVGRR